MFSKSEKRMTAQGTATFLLRQDIILVPKSILAEDIYTYTDMNSYTPVSRSLLRVQTFLYNKQLPYETFSPVLEIGSTLCLFSPAGCNSPTESSSVSKAGGISYKSHKS